LLLAEHVRETVLDNGLKILAVPRRLSSTASLALCYRVGSRHERSGLTGISHVFEHLMFKGTPRFPQGAFDRILQEQGMSYNAFTSRDCTIFYESMAADRLEVALELEADRMENLLLVEEEFQSEMSVIREERRQTVEDTPMGLLVEGVEATVYLAHPYHWPIIGWMEDLERLRLSDVQAYYRDLYRPNNAVLVVVGDFDEPSMLAAVERSFGRIARGPDVPPLVDAEPLQRGERMFTVEKEVQLPALMLAWRTGEARGREARVLNVIEFLLLHGRSSRLFQSMIYQEQIATGLGGGMQLRAGPSLFTLHATARPGVPLSRVGEAFDRALDGLAEQPVSEEEMAKVRRGMESDYVFGQEAHLEVALNLGEDECRGSWRDYPAWLADCLSVTPEEVQATVRAVLTRSRRVTGRLVPISGDGREQA